MHDTVVVNTDTVDNSINIIDRASSLLEKAGNKIDNAKGQMESGILEEFASAISNSFSTVSSGITYALSETKSIMNQCNEFVQTAGQKVSFIEQVSSQLTANLSTFADSINFIMNLGGSGNVSGGGSNPFDGTSNEALELLSFSDFIELYKNASDYFDGERQKIYNKFRMNLIVSTPTLIKNTGIDAFDAAVEYSYLSISEATIGTDEYNKELEEYKKAFAQKILSSYDNLDFVPEAYLEGADDYNKALIVLSFTASDKYEMVYKLKDVFSEIDNRNDGNNSIYLITEQLVDEFYDVKDRVLGCDTEDSEEMLSYYYNEIVGLKNKNDAYGEHFTGPFIEDDFAFTQSNDAWYDAIKDTEAFKKIEPYLGTDKEQIYELTNNLDFLATVYQYDGMEGLLEVYNDYISNCPGMWDGASANEITKEYLENGDVGVIVKYATGCAAVSKLYNLVADSRKNLAIIDDNEDCTLTLLAKNLDVSDVSEEDLKATTDKISEKWTKYCDGNDYTKYLEDWQIAAYAKISENDPSLAKKLFNMTEGADRGIFDEKIMEGYAYDVAKYRVDQMTGNGEGFIDYVNGFIFSNAYGLGYGVTDFTDGFCDAFGGADGKMNRRQYEKSYINMLLSTDYSLYSAYYHGDEKLDALLSSNYSDDFIAQVKLNNHNEDLDVEELLEECQKAGIPQYELAYQFGLITAEEYNAYRALANTSEEDLAYFAKLQDSGIIKGISTKEFQISNSVGNMIIPVSLSILGTATGAPVFSVLSYTGMFFSSYGRNYESMMQSGETDDAYMKLNSLLHASLETFGEMALGKVMGSTSLGNKLKEYMSAIPGLDTLVNAADNLNEFLVSKGWNKRLAKYVSNVVGEVIQENGENIAGWGIDAATSLAYKGEADLPTLDQMLQETWDTTWATALTTPILNAYSDIALSNVKRPVKIGDQEVEISLSDLLLFTDEETNTIDLKAMTEYLAKKGKLNLDNFGSTPDLNINKNSGGLDTSGMFEFNLKFTSDLKIPNIYKIYFDPKTNLYILEYIDGSIQKVNDFSEISNYNPSDLDFKLKDGKYYTENEINFFESLIPSFMRTAELDLDFRVEYSEEDINSVKERFSKFATNEFAAEVIEILTDELIEQMKRGNPYTKVEYEAFLSALEEKNVQIDRWQGKSVFIKAFNSVCFNNNIPLTVQTIFHEFAHSFHYFFDQIIDGYNVDFNAPTYDSNTGTYTVNIDGKTYNYTEIVENARNNFENGKYNNIMDYYFDRYRKGRNDYMQDSLRNEGKNFDIAVEELYNTYKKQLEGDNATEILQKIGIKGDNVNVTDADLRKAAEIAIITNYKYEYREKYGDVYGQIDLVSDIVDSLFGGEHDYDLIATHGRGYYGGRDLQTEANKDGVIKQYVEVTAEIIPIMQFCPQAIPILYDMFGEDYINMFNAEANKIYGR